MYYIFFLSEFFKSLTGRENNIKGWLIMSKVKILIVEDESIIAGSLKDILEDYGYEVTDIAATGEEAIEKCGKNIPDLTLMDIRLQGSMDGIETAAHIYEKFDIPVVYLTAYAGDDFLERAKQTKPFGYILKPFDERILHPTITMALEKHQQEKELRENKKQFSTFIEEKPVEITLRFLSDKEDGGGEADKTPEIKASIIDESKQTTMQRQREIPEKRRAPEPHYSKFAEKRKERKARDKKKGDLAELPTHSDRHKPLYSMKATAQRTGLDPNLIRHYERQGLIKPYRDPDNNYRLFTLDEIEWLEMINRLIHEAGLNIEGIKFILTLDPCWTQKDCPSDVKEACDRCHQSNHPCWFLKEDAEGECGDCYHCVQYIMAKRHPKLQI